MSAPDEATGSRGEVEAVAAVIAEHRYLAVNAGGDTGCRGCMWTTPFRGERGRKGHEAHVAAALATVLAEVRAGALREAARYLRRQGSLRFDDHGPHDARGAALWDAGCAIDPNDGNKVEGTA
jgi:hypothetical protein